MAVRNGDAENGGAAGAHHIVDERPSTSSSVGGEPAVFREAGTLQRSCSLHPEDPPPEPFVYKNLEEIAEKLGARAGPPPSEHVL